MLSELTHAVQYRRMSGEYDLGWHTMAAFDVETVALKYARDCERGGMEGLEYRVRDISKETASL